MREHCPGKFLEFADSSLGNSILVMRVYGSECHPLPVAFTCIDPLVCLEDSIVGVVILDFHSVPVGECLKCHLAFHRFLRGRRLLEVDEPQSTELVDVDGRVAVSLRGQESSHLCNYSWRGRDELVNRYHLTWLRRFRFAVAFLLGLASPRSFCCLGV